MKIFELSVWDFDGFTLEHLLTHSNKTELEFEQDVNNLLRELGQEYIDTAECWIEIEGWCQHILPSLYAMGYEDVKVHRIPFESEGIIRGKYRADWKKVVGESLYSAAIERNNKFEKAISNETD